MKHKDTILREAAIELESISKNRLNYQFKQTDMLIHLEFVKLEVLTDIRDEILELRLAVERLRP